MEKEEKVNLDQERLLQVTVSLPCAKPKGGRPREPLRYLNPILIDWVFYESGTCISGPTFSKVSRLTKLYIEHTSDQEKRLKENNDGLFNEEPCGLGSKGRPPLLVVVFHHLEWKALFF